MITDTCCCGAKFSANGGDWLINKDTHREWLLAHKFCRESTKREQGPQGWVLVPMKPTVSMLFAGSFQPSVRARWDAMLAAAPKPEET